MVLLISIHFHSRKMAYFKQIKKKESKITLSSLRRFIAVSCSSTHRKMLYIKLTGINTSPSTGSGENPKKGQYCSKSQLSFRINLALKLRTLLISRCLDSALALPMGFMQVNTKFLLLQPSPRGCSVFLWYTRLKRSGEKNNSVYYLFRRGKEIYWL